MRLYGTAGSPFVARVQIQMRAKSLPFELVPPPGGLGSTEMRKLSPFGRIPVLEVDGTTIPESSVIQEYLEDQFPVPSLRGSTAIQTARARLIARAIDLYLVPALRPLRAALSSGNREGIPNARTELVAVLDQIEALLALEPSASAYAVGEGLTLADCALLPIMFYVERFTAELIPDFSRRSWARLDACVLHGGKHPAVASVLGSMESATKMAS
jgi:glutathione S-transferase